MEVVKTLNELILPSKHHKFLKDDSFERLTWEEVIDNIDRNISENLYPEIKVKKNFGLVTHDIRDLLKVYPLRKTIQDDRPHLKRLTTHLYISLTSISETFGKHNDFMDVVIWQCLGITKWTIYDEKVYEYNLKPGEFLYIPMGMFHDTTPVTPRASISIGLEV